jgi:hypothetical protein
MCTINDDDDEMIPCYAPQDLTSRDESNMLFEVIHS